MEKLKAVLLKSVVLILWYILILFIFPSEQLIYARVGSLIMLAQLLKEK